MPDKYQPVIKRAKAICVGEENECWDDIKDLIEPCAKFILSEINSQVSLIKSSDDTTKSIRLG